MSGRAPAGGAARVARAAGVARVACATSVLLAALGAHAHAEPRGLVIDAGLGAGFFRPGDVTRQLEQIEFERVTSTTLDLALVAQPYARLGLALEFGYGRSWDGGFTQTTPRAFGFGDLVCEIDLEARDYVRFDGALIVDLAGGATRPFLVAGGGAWVFLEKDARSTRVCSDGTRDEFEVSTRSSAEEPLLILGGGVRFREGSRVGFRCDYRANIIFEDDGESLVNQLRVGVLIAPRG